MQVQSRKIMRLRGKKPWRMLLMALLGFFIFTVLVLYSWNSFAPDLFQLPHMQFKQAMGLVLFLFCLGFVLRFATGNRYLLKHEELSQ